MKVNTTTTTSNRKTTPIIDILVVSATAIVASRLTWAVRAKPKATKYSYKF